MGFGIGRIVNAITGASDSASQANKYNKRLANLSYTQQKEFAQNAHQWEALDFDKAGYNPALTTGASSASSIAGQGDISNSGAVGSSAMSPMDIIGAINGTRATSANNDNLNAQGELARAQAMATIEMLPINKQEKQELIKQIKAQTKNTEEDTKYKGFFPETTSFNAGGFGVSGGGSQTRYNKHSAK